MLPSKKCDSTIPKGHFLDGEQVIKCDETCETCNGVGPNKCLSCISPEIFRLNKESKCIDCTKDYQSNKESCSYVVEVRLVDPALKTVNSKASHTVRFSFDGESKHSQTLTKEKLRTALKLEILEMKDSEYSLFIEFREGEIAIDFYSTISMSGTVSLKITPIKKEILIDPTTGAVSLYFLETPAIKMIPVKESPNAEMMESLEGIQKGSEGTMSAIAGVASVLSAIAVLASSPILAPLIKFLKIFKLVSRLKLINIFFGAYLEFILMISGLMFNIGDDNQANQFSVFGVQTRGRLTKYKVTTVSVEPMWFKFMAYYLIILLRMYQAKIRTYIKRRANLSFDDRVVDQIVDQSRVVVFTMLVIDILFYSTHTVLHMDLKIKQTRDSNISFVLSCLAILIISVDVITLLLANMEMSTKRIVFERKLVEIKEKNDKVRKRRLAALKEGDAPKKNESSDPAPREIEQNMREAQQPAISGEKAMKKDRSFKIPKHVESSSFAAECFFTEGIKTEALKEGMYFNSLSMIKLIIVEPFYVSLQMLPTMQIVCLFGIQLSFFIYFLNLAFRKKVFIYKIEVIQVFMNEISILIFLTLGLLFQLAGGINNMSTQLSTILQIIGMVSLAISCITGSCAMLYSTIKSLYRIAKGIISSRVRKEYQSMKGIVDDSGKPTKEAGPSANKEVDPELPAKRSQGTTAFKKVEPKQGSLNFDRNSKSKKLSTVFPAAVDLRPVKLPTVKTTEKKVLKAVEPQKPTLVESALVKSGEAEPKAKARKVFGRKRHTIMLK